MSNSYDLDTPLITFGDESDPFTIREAVTGVQIFGGIGGGKTSGSRTLALKYLRHGFGGLVLTAKPDERKLWESYCREAGRLDDLIVIEPLSKGGKHTFNFLDYEAQVGTHGTPLIENVVQVLKTVIRSNEEKNGGKSDDAFWESALDMLLFNTIDLCLLAFGTISVQHLFNLASSAPKKEDQTSQVKAKPGTFAHAFETARDKVNKQIADYQNSLSEEQKAAIIDNDHFERIVIETLPDAALLKSLDRFFMDRYKNLPEKTRSIIEFSFSGFLFRLLKEPVYSLFCNQVSTFKPDDSLDGKIILVDLPVKTYYKVGRDAQIMFKYIWQRAMEKRDVSINGRPVFLWADEAQLFIHEHDAEFQATARSSRIATVYISQNMANYHANMGSEKKSEHRVTSFLGTLATKMFYANADIETNNYASDLIGQGYALDESTSSTMAGEFSSSRSESWKLEKMVRPEEFATLKNGGPKNNYQVQCYMHRQGSTFEDGLPFRKVKFNQQ